MAQNTNKHHSSGNKREVKYFSLQLASSDQSEQSSIPLHLRDCEIHRRLSHLYRSPLQSPVMIFKTAITKIACVVTYFLFFACNSFFPLNCPHLLRKIVAPILFDTEYYDLT